MKKRVKALLSNAYKEYKLKEKNKLQFGTKEWASSNFNFINGCSNDCVYCYAKEMAIRFKRKTSDSWKKEEFVNFKDKSYSKKNGLIMLPSSHDITIGNIELTLQVIEKLVNNGNTLLIVSKPNFECIKKIVTKFLKFKNQILFRFTIGSSCDETLKLWEPFAPSFDERLNSLKLAYDLGFSTSISCEPLLDNSFDELYLKVKPFVTSSIWIGKMNLAAKRVKTNTNNQFPMEKVNELVEWQSDENIISLYNKYSKESLIKWKESIKKIAIKYNLD